MIKGDFGRSRIRARVMSWQRFVRMKASGRLIDIGRYYGTDKSDQWHSFRGQTYLDVYEQYFRPFKRRPITLLEIGVRNGQSLKTWSEYFSRSRIYGLDIDPQCSRFSSEQVQIRIGSQDDPKVVSDLVEEAGCFDIVIDDGSHVNTLTLRSFELLFKSLKPGGLYILEDLGCSYLDLSEAVRQWPGMELNNSEISYRNDRTLFDTFFQQIIKDMDHLRGDIRSIQFWPMMCFIVKA